MVPPNNLGPDLNGKSNNETQYRGMIGSIMYLTGTRHDIQFSTCLCARYQANPKESHLIDVKRIFRYLKGNSQVKDNKIDLLVQQLEQFVISEDESINSAFAIFNTIITSLKALDEGYSSKNYVRKFLRALHPEIERKGHDD
ncbi:hypothetical protein Tco_0621132 [Tanacetum coccineum]